MFFDASECPAYGLHTGTRAQIGPALEVDGESSEKLTGTLSRDLVPTM